MSPTDKGWSLSTRQSLLSYWPLMHVARCSDTSVEVNPVGRWSFGRGHIRRLNPNVLPPSKRAACFICLYITHRLLVYNITRVITLLLNSTMQITWISVSTVKRLGFTPSADAKRCSTISRLLLTQWNNRKGAILNNDRQSQCDQSTFMQTKLPSAEEFVSCLDTHPSEERGSKQQTWGNFHANSSIDIPSS